MSDVFLISKTSDDVTPDVPYKGHYFHHEDSTLMALSKPNNLLKAPSPNTITLRVKSSIYEFWGT